MYVCMYVCSLTPRDYVIRTVIFEFLMNLTLFFHEGMSVDVYKNKVNLFENVSLGYDLYY